MKLVFIRHAEPDYKNNTLTEKGFLEAKALGEMYSADDFDEIYCSPLPRAKLTCEAVIKGQKEIKEEQWLEEFVHPITINGEKRLNWDLYPSFVEQHKDELFDLNTYLSSPLMKEAEMDKYAKEVLDNFDEILAKHGYIREWLNYKVVNPNDKTIVFFAHLGLNSLLISHLIHIPYWQVAQYFCLLSSSVTTFVSEEREEGIAQFRCIGLSDVTHLTKKGMRPSFAGRYRETRDLDDRK